MHSLNYTATENISRVKREGERKGTEEEKARVCQVLTTIIKFPPVRSVQALF